MYIFEMLHFFQSIYIISPTIVTKFCQNYCGRPTVTTAFNSQTILNISDPFVRVALLCGGKRTKKKRTTTKRNTTSPAWNEAIVFNVQGKDSFTGVQLEFAVFSDNLLGTNEMMGRLVVGDHVTANEQPHWLEMVNSKSVPVWHQLQAPDA